MVHAWRLGVVALLGAGAGACGSLYDVDPGAGRDAASHADADGATPHDARPADAETLADADPDLLALAAVAPSVLVEGQGAGGSAPAVLVISGRQIVLADTTVAITVHGGSDAAPGITVDNAHLDVAADGQQLAVPVAFAVDVADGSGAPALRVDVRVTQRGASGPVTQTLGALAGDAPVLELQYLDELTNASAIFVAGAVPSGTYTFSQVTVTGGLRPADAIAPLRITAVSSISITGVTSVDAVLGAPGAGGHDGGDGGGASSNGPARAGGTGSGSGGGASSGGGGGFGTAGLGASGGSATGEAALVDLAGDRSSGGGGGVGGVGAAAAGGGVGGAGGGVLELTAGGDMTLGALTGLGGNGTPTAAAVTASGGGGGGGSGGTFLLRARHALTYTTVTATGGLAGGGGLTPSFAGGDGRVRIDVPTALVVDSTPASYRGPVLAIGAAAIVRTALPTLAVVGAPGQPFRYTVTNAAGTVTSAVQLLDATGADNVTLPPDQPLARGRNRLCLLVAGATAASPPEAMNCSDLAYLYTP